MGSYVRGGQQGRVDDNMKTTNTHCGYKVREESDNDDKKTG